MTLTISDQYGLAVLAYLRAPDSIERLEAIASILQTIALTDRPLARTYLESLAVSPTVRTTLYAVLEPAPLPAPLPGRRRRPRRRRWLRTVPDFLRPYYLEALSGPGLEDQTVLALLTTLDLTPQAWQVVHGDYLTRLAPSHAFLELLSNPSGTPWRGYAPLIGSHFLACWPSAKAQFQAELLSFPAPHLDTTYHQYALVTSVLNSDIYHEFRSLDLFPDLVLSQQALAQKLATFPAADHIGLSCYMASEVFATSTFWASIDLALLDPVNVAALALLYADHDCMQILRPSQQWPGVHDILLSRASSLEALQRWQPLGVDGEDFVPSALIILCSAARLCDSPKIYQSLADALARESPQAIISHTAYIPPIVFAYWPRPFLAHMLSLAPPGLRQILFKSLRLRHNNPAP